MTLFRSRSIATFRHGRRAHSSRAALALGGACLLWAAGAGAEALTRPGLLPAPTVRIGAERIAPATLDAGAGGTFVLANASTALARVEFHVRRGTRLSCLRGDGEPVVGRKFVIEDGDTLRCEAPDGRLDYAVFRNLRVGGGSFRTLRSDGRVER